MYLLVIIIGFLSILINFCILWKFYHKRNKKVRKFTKLGYKYEAIDGMPDYIKIAELEESIFGEPISVNVNNLRDANGERFYWKREK